MANPSVKQEVFSLHCSRDGIMRDFCDAYFVKSHPILSAYPNALQFILYYDDIKIANPKAGAHKLGGYSLFTLLRISLSTGMFYYVLGNIHPVFQSSLQCIQLIAVAKSVDIKTPKYGCDALLQPFIDQINMLEKVYRKYSSYIIFNTFIAASRARYSSSK